MKQISISKELNVHWSDFSCRLLFHPESCRSTADSNETDMNYSSLQAEIGKQPANIDVSSIPLNVIL